MKRKWISVLLVVVMCMSLSACGNKKDNSQSYSESIIKEDTLSTEEEVAVSEAVGEDVQKPEALTEEALAEWEQIGKASEQIKLGNTYTVDGVLEFSIQNCYWEEDDVLPENPDGVYCYIETEEGYCYLICKGKIKNLSDDRLYVSNMLAGEKWLPFETLFLFDDSGLYRGRWYTGSTSISDSVDAEAEDTLYIVVVVPTEIKETTKKVQMLIGLNAKKNILGEMVIDWMNLTDKYFWEVPLP